MAKIGEGTLAAMGRLGLAELRNAANPSPQSVADKEIGLYGTATQGEIAQARAPAEPETPQENLTIDSLRHTAREPDREAGRERTGPEPDRGPER